MTAAKLILSLLAFAATLSIAKSQPAHETAKLRLNGIPLYRIYEEKDIEDNSRGNFITTSPDNRLFFGNETGVHVFDGTNWKLIIETVASRDKIRSLHWTQGRLFAAGYNTIGTLEFDPVRGVRYQAINDQPLSSNAGEFYDRIYEDHDWLHFIGQRNVASYNMRTGEIATKTFDTWISASAYANETLYLATDRNGLWKRAGSEFQLIEAFSSFIDDHAIELIATHPEGKIVFVTQNGQLFQIENETPINAYPNFNYDQNELISSLEFIDQRRLAVSIPGQGILIIDDHGDTLAKLDKSIDYRWGAVRQLKTDHQGSLWVMLNTAIGKVLLDSPVSPIDERLRPSLYYPLANYYDGCLYLCANGKLYKSEHSEDGQLIGFKNALPQSDLSIALALTGEDGLYIHAEGTTYLLSGETLTPLGSHQRIDRLVTFKNDPNLFLGLSSTHAVILQREGASIREIASINHGAGLVNKVARAPDNVFWLEIGLGQVGKIWVENNQPHFKLYTAKNGLPPDWVAIWEHEDQVLITESSGVYSYVPETESFRKLDDFEYYFPSDQGSLHRVKTDPQGNVWASYDNFNYILWKQQDGSYLKDNYSLSQLGEIYVNEFTFLENGNAVLLTENEVFHIDSSNFKPISEQPNIQTEFLEISNIEGSEFYFLNSGNLSKPETIQLNSNQSSVLIRVGNTFSSTVKQPSFQYFMDGLSKDWSKWSTSNEIAFTNLEAGNYVLRIHSKIGETIEQTPITLPISIAPNVWETPYAYATYLILTASLILLGYNYFSRNLKTANEKLEQMVLERTREIEAKNAELQANATTLTQTLDELRSAQDKLMTTSRKAGMAEVATNVLHNVGNVLNSINVGVLSLADSIDNSKVEKLAKVVELIESNRENLDTFFTQNAKGKAVPEYLRQLAKVMKEDFSQYQLEIDCMSENIEHVKKIITTQQAHAKTVDVYQSVFIPELLEAAITMIMGDSEHSLFEVTRDFDSGLEIVSDKHRILQMVANFIKNAKEAIKEAENPIGIIKIGGHFDETRENVIITVTDNGSGISPENLSKIFTHGFTTKDNGHGFGMHSCSNSAKIIGGNLSIASEGINKGATVTLTLPVMPPARKDMLTKNPTSNDQNSGYKSTSLDQSVS